VRVILLGKDLVRKRIHEVEEDLKGRGYRYLGTLVVGDSNIRYWVKEEGDGKFSLVTVEEWADFTEVKTKEVTEEQLREIEERIEERAGVWRRRRP